jgi:hypothetical protein
MSDQPRPPLPPDVEAFLASSGRSFLVTLRPDGSPTAHPMTALSAGGQLAYNTYRKSAKARNAARDPRTCSLLLVDYADSLDRALVYKGAARPLDPAGLELARPASAARASAPDSAVPDRAIARLQEGKRVLLGVDAEELAMLDHGSER